MKPKTVFSKTISLALSLALIWVALLAPAAAEAALPADGVYTGTANGMGGALEVSVSSEGGRIAAVEVGFPFVKVPVFFLEKPRYKLFIEPFYEGIEKFFNCPVRFGNELFVARKIIIIGKRHCREKRE